MRKLRALEDLLIRVESALAVVLVLTMLLLAAYNVVYRNVLVRLQNHWAHSGPPVERAPVEAAPAKTEATPVGEAKADTKADTKAEPVDSAREGGGDDFEGFGGGLGEEGEEGEEDEEGEAETKAEPKAETKAVADEKDEPAKTGSDDFGGFGGGLDDEPEPAPTPPPAKAPEMIAKAEPAKPAKSESDDFGGFGGGLGDDEPEDAEPEAKATKAGADDFGGFGGGLDDGGDEAKAPIDADAKAPSDAKAPAADDDLSEDELDGEDDLGDDDQFANLPDIDAVAKQSADSIPQGGPPPEGSFAAWAIRFIDDIKLDWIDVFLRQLVIIVAFFGAMLATQRGKHINVDALSKVLPRGIQRVVAVLLPLTAVAVCLVLARAGWDLVQISREYPKDLLPSVPEWSLQLMFPVGFGLLAVHFMVRIVEAVVVGPAEPEPPPRAAAPPPVAAHEADEEDEEDDEGDDDAAASKGGSR